MRFFQITIMKAYRPNERWVNSPRLWAVIKTPDRHSGIALPWRRAIFFTVPDSGDVCCVAAFSLHCDKLPSMLGVTSAAGSRLSGDNSSAFGNAAFSGSPVGRPG
jgi:hypothetical protein